MCKCDICKRRSRTIVVLPVFIYELGQANRTDRMKQVICMNCMHYLLREVDLVIKGIPEQRVAFFDSDRNLVYQSQVEREDEIERETEEKAQKARDERQAKRDAEMGRVQKVSEAPETVPEAIPAPTPPPSSSPEKRGPGRPRKVPA